MPKPQFTDEDDDLLSELGVETEDSKPSSRPPREERIIAGFEDIERFYEQHHRLPVNSEGNDIFERLYAVRLNSIRNSAECRAVLATLDKRSLLGATTAIPTLAENLDDETLLAELGATMTPSESDITQLTHVRTRAEIKAAEEIASRVPCPDFEKFKPLFLAVQNDLKTGERKGRRFEVEPSVEQGDFFILGGQIAYVAEVGEPIRTSVVGKPDARLRVIYDNGTESDLLLRSLQRALYKDEAGRRITDPSLGPLFADVE